MTDEERERMDDYFIEAYCLLGAVVREGKVGEALKAIIQTHRFIVRDIFVELTKDMPPESWRYMHGEPKP